MTPIKVPRFRMIFSLPCTIPDMRRCVFFLFLTAALSGQSATDVEITAEPHHRLFLSNDQVRVFNVEIAAKGETLMHRHRNDYVYVALGSAEVVNTVEGKDPVTVKLQDGETNFLAAGFAHSARNLSNQPFREVIIEFLQDEKLRKAASHWEEERGLDILQGGTKEILFVKDGVRVSETELQPGGMEPRHRHAGPFLVVALTDYELRNEIVGKAAINISMKMGESQWVAGGFDHMVMNAGQRPAKFVTLEFP